VRTELVLEIPALCLRFRRTSGETENQEKTRAAADLRGPRRLFLVVFLWPASVGHPATQVAGPGMALNEHGQAARATKPGGLAISIVPPPGRKGVTYPSSSWQPSSSSWPQYILR